MIKLDPRKLSPERMPERWRSSWRGVLVAVGVAFIVVIIVAFILALLEGLLVRDAQAAELFDYQALRVEQSYPGVINLEAGKGFTFWVKFKNVGAKNWFGSDKIKLRTASGKKGVLYHQWWLDTSYPCVLEGSTLYTEEALFRFAIQAPETDGLYWEKFILVKDDKLIPGGEIEIAVRSYGGQAPDLPTGQPQEDSTPEPVNEKFWLEDGECECQAVIQNNIKYEEPLIRVGLYYIEEEEREEELPLQIIGFNDQPYQVRDQENNLLVYQTAGEATEIDFDYELQRYFINLDGQRYIMTDSFLKFIPQNEEPILKIPTFNNNFFWGKVVEDNEFRGELEVHYNPNTERLWVINKLRMEEYLKGVTEVGDSSHAELLKAQSIAARTYAMARLFNPKYTNTPNETGFFDVRATQADQVYRGYGGEKRSPNTVQAATATQGMMVAYNDEPILAYYFACSDGRTRDCYQAGMCRAPVPWLVGKLDPPCQGKTMRGHGVGMSQIGARFAALNGANFEQILTYYYTEVEVEKLY